MKTALIIGGTQGFGKEMTTQLKNRGYTTHTVGRSPESTYQCDILNNSLWQDTLGTISQDMKSIDVLVCVPGFAQAKNPQELDEDDWHTAHQGNLGYIVQALNSLRHQLDTAPDHRVITLGSRWSLSWDCPLLIPYVQAKHQLVDETRLRAKQNHISCYCVPPMDTPGLTQVIQSFQNKGFDDFSVPGTAQLEIVANTILEHNLPQKGAEKTVSGKTYMITLEGELKDV